MMLRMWTERFGILPRVFFSDQGGEFTAHSFTAYLKDQGIKHLLSPPQSPYTNGINERHNGILKVWLGRIATACPDLPLPMVLMEATRVKNATTRRKGFSSTFLAFGYKPEDELQASIQDLLEPATHPDQVMRQRLEARAAAHRTLAEFISSEKLKASSARTSRRKLGNRKMDAA